MLPRLLVLIALALPQSTPSGGAIAKLVPPIPTPSSFISDERKVLTPAGHQELDGLIRAIQAAGRGDIAVAILPSIGDYSAMQVGLEIYRTWKVGAQADIGVAKRDLGMLVLIVPKELSPNNRGECWITTGLGAEGMITDAFAASVCRQWVIPRLRERDFDGAVRAGITALDRRLSMDAALVPRADSAIVANPNVTYSLPGALRRRSQAPAERSWFLRHWVLSLSGVGVLLIAGWVAFMKIWRNMPRKCRRCGQGMTRLDEASDDAHLEAGERVEEEVKSVDYDVWKCTCGNAVAIPWRNFFTEFSTCRECSRYTAKAKRRVLRAATYSADGLAEDTFVCRHCRATWVEEVRLPQKQRASSGGGRSGSGGSRGGGSSFGGSGRSGGGGGGSSY